MPSRTLKRASGAGAGRGRPASFMTTPDSSTPLRRNCRPTSLTWRLWLLLEMCHNKQLNLLNYRVHAMVGR